MTTFRPIRCKLCLPRFEESANDRAAMYARTLEPTRYPRPWRGRVLTVVAWVGWGAFVVAMLAERGTR